MCVDRAIIEIVIIADDILHEGFALDDSFHIPDDIFEDRELGLRELHLLTRERSDMVLCIDFYISEAEIFSIFDFFFLFSTLRDRCYTSDELTRGKWLRDVVICTELEKSDFIIFAFTG